MKKINKNIAFDYDNISKIEKYAKDNNMTFTASVNQIVGNSMPYDKQILSTIDKNIATNKYVTNLVLELLKQLYSDLAFSKLSNVKDSKTLNEFLRKKNSIDD